MAKIDPRVWLVCRALARYREPMATNEQRCAAVAAQVGASVDSVRQIARTYQSLWMGP